MEYWFRLLIKSQGKRLYWGILWVVLTALSGVSLLMLSGWFITATAIAGVAISAGVFLMFDMYMPGSGIRFFALSRTVGRYTERVYNHDSVLRLISVFRVSLFKELSQLSTSQLRKTSDSEWLGKLTADLDALDSILLRYTIAPIAGVIVIVLLSLFLSFIWFEMALVLGGFFLALYILSISVSLSFTKTLAGESSKLLSDLRAQLIEHLHGAFELQAQGLMHAHEAKIQELLEALNTVQNRLNKKISNVQLALDICLGLGLLSLVFIALHAANLAQIDGPTAVLLVMMFMGTTEILQSIPSQFATWGKTAFAARRLGELTSAEPNPAGVSIDKIDSLSVQLSQQSKIPASHSSLLSFAVTQNSLLVIVGRSGSGKSSLANVLSAVESIDNKHSNILINGDLPLANIDSSSWHKHLAYLEQGNSILAGSLGYNLALGLNAVSEDSLWSVLIVLELEDWAKQLPKGLNTWLGETGGLVSGGQARRICMARCLLREPNLLIMDEPFNGLDADMSARIWHNMSDWLAQRMVVLLTHEQPAFLSDAQQQYLVSLDQHD
ncbi:amino acid ABC transporter ATP-binding/permease protein [Glaciecola sp. SC05]|uniref:amino acid ABC transporter ATP-binding/permease protein n=1 Tax=Glaciecola sp. SC05 TaxID=1987355 RepID=UPI0035293E12